MIYLILCIVSSSLLLVTFKVIGRLRLDVFPVIVINYIIAALIGFSIDRFPFPGVTKEPWFVMAIIIGVLFIWMFFVIAMTTQKAGIAVTSVASKMSVIIPITFSILYFGETVTLFKLTGFFLALVSVILTIYRKSDDTLLSRRALLLPVILFFGAGLIDSLIKFTQETYIGNDNTIMFSSVLFTIAAITGIIIIPFKKNIIRKFTDRQTIVAGIILGVINFGSLYGLIRALDSRVFDSSIIFGINNIGIVLLSMFFALIIFAEKLSLVNKIGVILSIITIILLSKV
ncbi:MAG: hypothetical protein K8R35_05365 [Bacteroidales bacterium]|nr:hypothetical protein [Bacteroidales bacterium]